jgi:Ribbon-helix-helix protein, copG family.
MMVYYTVIMPRIRPLKKRASRRLAQIVINDVPDDLLKDLDEIAREEDRSRASLVRQIIANAVKARRNHAAAA